ncbi:uncharacterized protein LOC107040674 [Diachasma alloeum]|uniref:Odorant receptor n=1 Tax=Diachasma alloeum TaxID=454923 RepID=A0A4E0RJG0_9HYME|nr:uncharacterized protein LOC107040674 [Diachasma alloeum]THK32882.1 odorant receptor 172 [Diachasma alloeum]
MSSLEKAIKADAQYKDAQQIIKRIRYCMLITGTWPISNPGILYRAIPYVTALSLATLGIALMWFTIVNITNITIMVKGFSLGVSCISMLFKVFLFTFYKEMVNELYTTLHDYYTESLADKKFRYMVLDGIGDFRRLFWLLSAIAHIGCIMYTVMPIIFMIIQIRRHVHPLKYLLPVSALFPWEITPGGLVYKITYVYESYNIWCLYFITVGMDPLFVYFVYQIIGQLRVLGYEISNLPLADNLDGFLRQWVSKFLVLRGCCEKLQTVWGPLILWQIITNSAIICTVFFQISQGEITVVKALTILTYSGGKILQSYLYSWAGSYLTAESEVLTETVYFSDWLGKGRHRYRTSVLVMLTQKPLQVIAANWVPVSLNLFVMTLNTAVSYFFLLQTFEEKQS